MSVCNNCKQPITWRKMAGRWVKYDGAETHVCRKGDSAFGARTPRTDFSLPECNCPVLPWDDCAHTGRTQ